jgi:hypothetical protein
MSWYGWCLNFIDSYCLRSFLNLILTMANSSWFKFLKNTISLTFYNRSITQVTVLYSLTFSLLDRYLNLSLHPSTFFPSIKSTDYNNSTQKYSNWAINTFIKLVFSPFSAIMTYKSLSVITSTTLTNVEQFMK